MAKKKYMYGTSWKDGDNNYNRVDDGGNHFINGVCVNPKSSRFNSNVKAEELGDIGDTY